MTRATLAICAALIGLAGCGGDDGPPRLQATTPTTVTTPPPVIQQGVAKTDVDVVREWADTLRRGDVAAAAKFFAVPSLVANAGPPARLTTRAAVLDFNKSLPCGARLLRADRSAHGFVIATFVLTERPGPGNCDAGTDNTARTAFRVRGGKITDWLRVEDLPEAATTTA